MTTAGRPRKKTMLHDKKKIIYIFLAFFVFLVVAGSGYMVWHASSPQKTQEKENPALAPMVGESLRKKLQEKSDENVGQIRENIQPAGIDEENLNNETTAEQEGLIVDQKTTETDQDEEEIPPAEIAVEIIARGSPAGNAEEIRNLLKSNGYEKSEIGGGKGAEIVQTLIFFKEERFRREAQAVRELLIQKGKIYSALGMAASVEEKSADIVIFLGKYKEAPPN